MLSKLISLVFLPLNIQIYNIQFTFKQGESKMSSNGSTSLRVSGARKRIAESLALEISIQCGKVIKVSDVLNFVLDRYLNTEMVDDFIEKWKIEQEKEIALQSKRKTRKKRGNADET